MAFFYDTTTNVSPVTQYKRYLESDWYIRNLKHHIDDPLNYQLFEIKRTMQEGNSATINNANTVSRETQKHFEKLTADVCGTLQKGFGQVVGELEDINWRLNDINEGISSLYSLLDWKTDIMVEEQKITNLYLGRITGLLQIPDSQKQRGYHVEEGLKYLKIAIKEGSKSDYYSDALDEFSNAQKIEAKDYFSLNKIGLIHLYSLKHFDVTRAEEYFKLSIRYAKALANANPSYANIAAVASALNYASRCNYILARFSEAVQLAKQAFELEPKNLEHGLQLAKCLAANNQEKEATNLLYQVIEMDKHFAMKFLLDMDFIGRPFIRKTIESLFTNLVNYVTKQVNEIKNLIITDSKGREQFDKVKIMLTDPTYLNARTASEILSKKQEWGYIHYSQDSQHYYPTESKKFETLTLRELVEAEYIEQKTKVDFIEKYKIADAIRERKFKKEKRADTIGNIVAAIIIVLAALAIEYWIYSKEIWLPIKIVFMVGPAFLTIYGLNELFKTK